MKAIFLQSAPQRSKRGFRWLECRPQLFEKQQPDAEPKFDTEQQKAAYWIKHFLEKGDMSANEIYCRLDNVRPL